MQHVRPLPYRSSRPIARLAAVLFLGTFGVAAESAAQIFPTPTPTPLPCACYEALGICLANAETEHRACLGVGCSKERAQIAVTCDGTGRPLRMCKQAIAAFKQCVKGCTREFLLRTGVCASTYKDCEYGTGKPCPTPALRLGSLTRERGGWNHSPHLFRALAGE